MDECADSLVPRVSSETSRVELSASRLMDEFDNLPASIQTMVIDGHRPLREALAATVAEALEDQPGRDPELVHALIDGIATAATR